MPELDDSPLVVPVPNEQQLYNVPVVSLKSKNSSVSVNIARARADIFIAGEGREKFDSKRDKIIEDVKSFFNYFYKLTKIKRIGFVTRFFVEDDDQDKSIERLLADQFKDLNEGSVHEAFVRYVTRIENMSGFSVNNFTSVEKKLAKIKGVGDNVKGVLITRDFNTDPEQSYVGKFNAEIIEQFLNMSEQNFNLDKIKNILWPSEQ